MPKRKTAPVLLESNDTGGRARVFIDRKVLKALAAINCNLDEMAAGLVAAGCTVNVRTLKRRLQEDEFRDIVEQGKSEGRIGLRRLQWRHAQMPNSAGVQMTQHLSRHWLGETDKAALELTGRIDSNIEVKASARERLARKLDALDDRIKGTVDKIAAKAGATKVSRQPV